MEDILELEVTFKVRYTVHSDWYGTTDHQGIIEAEKQHLLSEGIDMIGSVDSQADSVALVDVTVVDTESE